MEASDADGDSTSVRGVDDATLLVASGGSFDLPALCLSSLASPAFTEGDDGYHTDAYSLASGMTSLTTDPKDDTGGQSDREQSDEELEHSDKGLSDKEQRDQAGDATLNAGGDTAGDGESAERMRCSEDVENAQGMIRLYDDEPQLADRNEASPRDDRQQRVSRQHPHVDPRSGDRSDNESDEDMTVECASPRNLADLDQDGEHVKPSRGHEVTGADLREHEVQSLRAETAVVHPLSLTDAPGRAPAAAPPSAYSVKSIFPEVYEMLPRAEEARSFSFSTKCTPHQLEKHDDVKVEAKPTTNTGTKTRSGLTGANGAAEKTSLLQREVESLKSQLQDSAKMLTLQLHVAETERKQLAQRNSRLKSQITALTADLVRTKADAAKWKTENELYALKMPKLQAELSEETAQVDEKHAQTIQSQLDITQLRAKVQVLQTRARNLESQVDKLQGELRLCKKELRRRVIVQQQADEKLKKLETELHEQRTDHAQELQLSKSKLVATTQRLEHERTKRAADLKDAHHLQLEEVKTALAKAVKRRKECEHKHAGCEHELAVLKKRVEEQQQEARNYVRKAKTQEALLVRAERTDVSLRTQLTGLKFQLETLEREKHKLLRERTTRTGGARPTTASGPLHSLPRTKKPTREELNYSAVESPKQVVVSRTLCSCCEAILGSWDRAESLDSLADPVEASPIKRNERFTCVRCPALEKELFAAHDDAMQLRLLHSSELKMQAVAFERAVASVREARGRPATTPECA